MTPARFFVKPSGWTAPDTVLLYFPEPDTDNRGWFIDRVGMRSALPARIDLPAALILANDLGELVEITAREAMTRLTSKHQATESLT